MIRISSVVIDCDNFDKMQAFWREALHYISREIDPQGDHCVILKDPNGKASSVTIDQMEPYRGRMHLDLYTDDPDNEIKRLLNLGATIFQQHEPDTDFTILADPEGNLFCVVDTR